jgi:hypothetical protein
MLQTTAGAHGSNVPGWHGNTAYNGHSSHARAAPGDRLVPVSMSALTLRSYMILRPPATRFEAGFEPESSTTNVPSRP